VAKVSTKATYIRLEQLQGNIHAIGAHKYNNDNATTPIFIVLQKTTQTHGRRKKKEAQGRLIFSSKYILM
jgi:hypothetical protein